MLILIDLDCVTADFLGAIVKFCAKECNYKVDMNSIHVYDFLDNLPNEIRSQVYSFMNSDGFFFNLDLISGAHEVILSLLRTHTLYFATASPVSSKTAYYDKCKWVDKYFPMIGGKKVISAHDKFNIKGDILFDDNPKNLETFHSITVAMHYEYNKDCKSTYRVRSWSEFEKTVDILHNKTIIAV